MNQKAIEKTELNKILAIVSEYAVLEKTKEELCRLQPTSNVKDAVFALETTQECSYLLFERGLSSIELFPKLSDEIERAKKGSSLSFIELLSIGQLLRSIRVARKGIVNAEKERAVRMQEKAERLYDNQPLEEDIFSKIISDSDLADTASDKLYTIRRQIRLLNEKIRARLQSYLTGEESKYLQEGIVTMRGNRYVLPVRAEYKRSIKGFVHDRSQSGATFFIEPEEVLEMNNELRSLEVDEKQEVERILSELSIRVGQMGEELLLSEKTLVEIDGFYARAYYAYKTACIMPELNGVGQIEIKEGRHPLIDPKTVVPVSLKLGTDYRFLLVSGPNTGGKTVALKMVGLFCLMAACGLFVPCKKAVLSVFDEIYCDVGDSQSIEESLSTFSSHIKSIISIVEKVNEKSLVLIDELGGGTDPDEGQALAKAIVAHLLKTGCKGVVTTHYTSLKEFAYAAEGIENACMEFDSETLKPLYVMRIGLPGSSNAIGISRRLGLRESILEDALSALSEDGQKFERIVQSAERSRLQAEEELKKTAALKREWEEKISLLDKERESVRKEKEKLFTSAKAEARKIVNERTAEAEEMIVAIREIFEKSHLTEGDLIRARTLKNRLADKAFAVETEEDEKTCYLPAKIGEIRLGQKVFVKTVESEGIVQQVREKKQEAEVLVGNMKLRVPLKEIFLIPSGEKKEKLPKWKKEGQKKTDTVSVSRQLVQKPVFMHEVNVIGKTVFEALPDVEAFIDSAVLANIEEVRIVHGVGTGKLRAGIHEYLRTHKNVAEFRLGRYGEGETGVTIVKIK